MAQPILPIPIPENLEAPTKESSFKDLLAWVMEMHGHMEEMRAVLSNNFSAVSSQLQPHPNPAFPVGAGIARQYYNGLPWNLAAGSCKVGLSITVGANGNQINVTFTYLGVGGIILGNGAAQTFTCDVTVAGANGLDTGTASANTWYALYVITSDMQYEMLDNTANVLQPPLYRSAAKISTLFSTSSTSPTLPLGYNRFRRVGWMRYNGTNFYRFTNTGDWYKWNEDVTAAPFLVLNAGTATSFTAVDCSAVVPSTSTLCMMGAQWADNGTTMANGVALRISGGNGTNQGVGNLHAYVSSQTNVIESSFLMGLSSVQKVDYSLNSGANAAAAYLSIEGYYDPV